MKNTALFTYCAIGLSCALPLVAQPSLNPNPSRAVGQPELQVRSTTPNVVEGREFLQPWSLVVDRSSTPSPLYVADTGNNRVLAWRDAASFTTGARADLVIGQVDMVTTLPGGPGTSRTIGLSTPAAVAVDSQGNLYIADARNNRILRFPRPFASGDTIPVPDMVLGQPNFTTRLSNNGLAQASANGISLTSGNTIARTGLAFDSAGNLWFSDALNHRVLRYPKSALDAGASQPSADVVLGQSNFEDRAPAEANQEARLNKAKLRGPSGLTVDDRGRLYVADSLFRVVVFEPPFFNGRGASRVIGIGEQEQFPRPTTEYTLSNPLNDASPEGVFSLGNRVGVVDTGSSRIVIYDPFETWPAETQTRPSPPAKVVIGQAEFLSNRRNRALPEPGANSLNEPIGAFFHNNELFVADTNNNRVLVFPQAVTGAAATRVLGQDSFSFGAANLVEGKEMFLFSGVGQFGANEGGAVALDTRSNPPRLYVSDTFNHRILGYRDARIVRPGDRADLVIGQNDLNRNLINAPQGDPNIVTASGLSRPAGVAVDAQGNLWVADAGNGRVLRFPSPFDQNIPGGQRHQPNLVLGQTSFTSKITDATARTMANPFGIGISVDGHVVVSDVAHSRVLLFRKPENGDFSSGQSADRVFGQPDFFTTGRGSGPNELNSPHHITIDTDDRLYVTDPPSNRVQIYDRVTAPTTGNNPPPSFTLTQLSSPQGIFVSHRTGEIWVTNTGANRVLRYPKYVDLISNPRSNAEVFSNVPLAAAQDEFGNLYVAEGINRIAIYFNGLVSQNAASFNERVASPGMILSVYPRGDAPFGEETASFSSLPLPNELGGVQVLVNDVPAPLYFVSPRQINLLVPMSTPSSGTAEIQVVRAATQQILAAFPVPLAPVAPGLFVNQPLPQGGGQIAALNQDNTVNSPVNPISRGEIIQLFGTGQGFVSNAPPDGTAPTGPISTDERPSVLINSAFVEDSDIQYSGLAPSLVGVWQINVRIPSSVPPRNDVDVVVVLRSSPSNRGPNNQIIRTTIAVKQ